MRLDDGNFVVDTQVAQTAVKSMTGHLANQKRIFMSVLLLTLILFSVS